MKEIQQKQIEPNCQILRMIAFTRERQQFRLVSANRNLVTS